MGIFKKRLVYLFSLLTVSLFLRFALFGFLGENNDVWLRLVVAVLIFGLGGAFVLRGTAKIIEETTTVLSKRTRLASGVVQSLGTAFPDMVLGIVAAIVSLQLRSSDYLKAVNFAIIAAATTFGSNIYNIAHAAWCIFRQNLANEKGKTILMFPFIKKAGEVRPMNLHLLKPTLVEFDTAIDVLNALTLLTASVATSMVIFGQVKNPPPGISGDLYQLIKPLGAVVLILCTLIIYHFRKTARPVDSSEDILRDEEYYQKQPSWIVWLSLLIAGAAILIAAGSMIEAIQVISDVLSIPFVITGTLAGLIGCLGEIVVVHNFTVNPNGRIGDAVVGVAMDNIVTTSGAAIVALMGGIFLGGNALIIIFVIILSLNTVLIWQISKLKNYFLTTGSSY